MKVDNCVGSSSGKSLLNGNSWKKQLLCLLVIILLIKMKMETSRKLFNLWKDDVHVNKSSETMLL